MNRLKFIVAIGVCAMAMLVTVKSWSRTAILIAHYGSSDDSTRRLTIDSITASVGHAFPDIEIREAYISPVVRKNLAAKGISKDSPLDALLKLRVEGFDTVYVQSTTIIDGAEMAEVRRSVDEVAPLFSRIVVGNSLLHSPADCLHLVSILSRFPIMEHQAVIYVGHGNNLPSTATYSQLDYMFADTGQTHFHVSTIEGYPTADSTLKEVLRSPEIKKVTLIPLLLVCGNHTKNDIAGQFAAEFRANGYDVEVIMRGLAELPSVREMYIDKIRQLLD